MANSLKNRRISSVLNMSPKVSSILGGCQILSLFETKTMSTYIIFVGTWTPTPNVSRDSYKAMSLAESLMLQHTRLELRIVIG